MECSIQRGRVKKLNSTALVKAVGGKYLCPYASGPVGLAFWDPGLRISISRGSVDSEQIGVECW